ncbi:EipB family protein [Terasakiella pusilla]|uniref:EipB family protein n=1 Tax=Terasakiella pusilla TaxID=64973 RepID=UPI0012EBCCAA|nr:DUF1849 family protein [Terasakiella pusilla]
MKYLKLAVMSLFMLSQAEADEGNLRSHDATYLMTQVHQYGRDWSPVEQAQGLLRYKFRRTCDGWTVEHQTALDMIYENDARSQMVWHYTSWEAQDGSKLRFRTRTQTNGMETENISGEARHEVGETAVVYSQLSDKRLSLPAGTYFPTSHMVEALKQAEKGEVLFNGFYFDGSDDNAGFSLDTVMTRFDGKPLAKVEDVKLDKQPAWDMQLAFFDSQSQDSTPYMEIGARYRQDGVTTRLMQNFGDFVLQGRLIELTYADEPVCP